MQQQRHAYARARARMQRTLDVVVLAPQRALQHEREVGLRREVRGRVAGLGRVEEHAQELAGRVVAGDDQQPPWGWVCFRRFWVLVGPV
jgi:hypothetical protein